ncbi:hypothetical protein G6F37_009831 [Rhizopus arrhizus]|nr:hypothetical protein G6F38_009630 [Rhizopus arrhizus]KAG1154022.1 hypothetical protein G6F37_009831 [Rhizopus arrhizus]
MTEKVRVANTSGNLFGRSLFSTVTSSINSLSQSIQTKGLPEEINKQLTKFQQQAKSLPTRFGNFQFDLESERSSFILDKKKQENLLTSQSKGSEPVAPWFGYKGYEKQMRKAIMEIPKDKRNLLISPPDDTSIQFDFNVYSLTAHAALKEDKELASLRFALVPQHVSEHDFWRNYFYRVTLIKQEILNNPPESDHDDDHKEQVFFEFQDNDDSDEEVNKKENIEVKEADQEAKQEKAKEEYTKKENVEPKKEEFVDINKVEDYEGMEEWEIELRKAAI